MIAIKKKNSTSADVTEKFVKAFCASVPKEDLEGWSQKNLKAVAASVYDEACRREEGKSKVRVFVPEKSADGWELGYTVVQIVADNMPFMLNSVTSELAAQNLSVETLFHPVLLAKRSKAGALQAVESDRNAPLEGYAAESYVVIVLEQVLSDEASAQLASALLKILEDVRTATADWKPMLQKMQTVRESLSRSPGKTAQETLDESLLFLEYLAAGNFTFLGYRYLEFSKTKTSVKSSARAGEDLGLLKDRTRTICFGRGEDSPEIAALEQVTAPIMISKLVDQHSTVHRRVPMDAVAIKVFDSQGKVTGAHLFVGLFTFGMYSCRIEEIPLVRKKVHDVVKQSGFKHYSHDRNALEHIVEKIPRDEMFQISSDNLYATAMGILKLQSKQRVALFMNMDNMQQYMSCLLYVPRDRYNTRYREKAGQVLERHLNGRVVNYYTSMDDSALARALFTIVLRGDTHAAIDREAINEELSEIGREWAEVFSQMLVDSYGKKQGGELAHIYRNAFPTSYHESQEISSAVHDIEQIEQLLSGEQDIRIDLYRRKKDPEGEVRLKLYLKRDSGRLSDILPLMEHMGLRCISEMPYEVRPNTVDNTVVWMHDFVLESDSKIDIPRVKFNFEETFLKVWYGEVESDAINRLIPLENFSWQDARILRAYNSFCRQAKLQVNKQYVEEVLGQYSSISDELVTFFKHRFDPSRKEPLQHRGEASKAKILEMLQSVERLDHDRILRTLLTLIDNTLRTNFYQRTEDGKPLPYLTLKLNSKNIPELPLPRPHVEIFVYSPRVEGVHLRGGKIARGGLRWSDRWDDFRTEVLGLLRAQMVKNTVIVPVGSKGGFIVKQPPATGGRQAYVQEGIECYKIFVSALLELTDNNIKGKIISPKDTVCYDEDDPYLVVAADKGTATFSDIANALSVGKGFWLQDAFASGGSTGYDHKAMGITARGGWESVKRHFREIGKDIQAEDFTVIGIGDMSGDVFGNAMLLSEHIRLVGAFNHVHIFCDPDPDAALSYKERKRLFENREGWDSYDPKKISKGGMVYKRHDKRLKLTPEIRKAFGIAEDSVTPDELIQAILRTEAELLWLGGIGTYIKSSKETNAEADDKANDSVRVNGNQLRVKVVGEGANLGVTQEGRIEYSRKGGRINTDFIDNSAGVDCSDHEVNIKILLSDIMEKRKFSMAQRNKLLERMTDDVAGLVLRDNYQQTEAISLMMFKSKDQLGLHADFIRKLEKSGMIKRSLERLPDDETLEALAREGKGLTRPELSLLLSYAKMMLYQDIMNSSVLDGGDFEELLFGYFPKDLQKYEEEIRAHKLKKEIIATALANIIVNRMGPLFVHSRISKTGASLEDVVRAFIIVANAFSVRDVWRMVKGLDNKVPAEVQLQALYETVQVVKRGVTWFLRFGGRDLDIHKEVKIFKGGVEDLRKHINTLVTDSVRANLKETEAGFIAKGMSPELAKEIAMMILLSSANDIVSIARNLKADIKHVASVYFQTGERFAMGWLRRQAMNLVPKNDWQARVISGLIDDFYMQQAALSANVMQSVLRSKKKDCDACIEEWFAHYRSPINEVMRIVEDLQGQSVVEIEMLTLVSQRIGQLVYKV